MPLLEQRRQPSANAARKLQSLTLSFFSLLDKPGFSWSVGWSVCHLVGFVLGSAMAGYFLGDLPKLEILSNISIDSLLFTRLSGLSLLIAPFLPNRFKGIFWMGVLGWGLLTGWSLERDLQARASAWATDSVSPSSAVEASGWGLFRLTGWPANAGADRWKAPGLILAWKGDKPWQSTKLKQHHGLNLIPEAKEGIYLTGKGKPPSPGEVIAAEVLARVPRSKDLPGSFNYRQFLAGRQLKWAARLGDFETEALGQWEVVSWLTTLRNGLAEQLDHILPEREARLATAVLLGIRTRESRLNSQSFSDLGLAHLFAVSGLHVGILLGVVLAPVGLLAWPAKGRFILLVVFLPVYCLLTGLPGSVVRAAGLSLLLISGPVFGRRSTSLHLLGLLFWMTTLLQPTQVLDVGVRLSYLAAGGILVTLGFMKEKGLAEGMGGKVLLALTVSLAAQWFTLPQTAISFGRFSLLSPLANLVVVPVFGIGTWAVVLALLTSSWWPWLGQALAALGWIIFRTLEGMVAQLSQFNGGLNLGVPPTSLAQGMVWAGMTIAGLVALYYWQNGRLNGRFLSLVLVGIIVTGHGMFAWRGYAGRAPEKVEVWQFQVGQGDCGLIRFPDGWNGLVDTAGVFSFRQTPPDGPLNRAILPFLRRNWINRLEAVVLSHGHLDHTGGTAALQGQIEVRHWYGGGDVGHDLAHLQLDPPIQQVNGPVLLHQWQEWKLEINHPGGLLPADFHENDHSLVMVLWQGDEAKMLWSGDLEKKGEQYFLDQGLVPERVQVWKAGHHGSSTSGSQPWMNRLEPELILISCGVDNKYRHPSHGWYLAQGDTIPVLRTDLDGSLRLQWSPQGDLSWRAMGKGH